MAAGGEGDNFAAQAAEMVSGLLLTLGTPVTPEARSAACPGRRAGVRGPLCLQRLKCLLKGEWIPDRPSAFRDDVCVLLEAAPEAAGAVS